MGADFHWGLIFKTKILRWQVLYYGWDINFIQRLFWGGIHHNLFAPTKSGVNSGKVKWGTLQLVNGVQQQ